MDWAHKLRKLATRDPYDSILEHVARATHPVHASRFSGGIDRAAWAGLRKRFPSRAGAKQINRYDDFDYWLRVNVERAQDLWLDRSPPLRILDLGSGAGYFLYVSKRL